MNVYNPPYSEILLLRKCKTFVNMQVITYCVQWHILLSLYFGVCIVQIPSSGWEKLFISFIPTELGKTTAKTTKANVRNGTCKWADPIYETTRLLQDTKTKQYDEKLYKLVVSMVWFLSTSFLSALILYTNSW